MGNIAIRSYMLRQQTERGYNYFGRKKLLWDGNAMKITNLEAANQFVGREYRSGWELKNKYMQDVIWITGASSGIGEELAKQYAQRGIDSYFPQEERRNLNG